MAPPQKDTPQEQDAADSGTFSDERASSSPQADCPEARLLLAAGAEDQLMLLLREQGPLHVDELARLAGQDSAALAVTLLGLEMAGRVRRLPGAHYEVQS